MDDDKQKRRLIENSAFFKDFDKAIIDAILPLLSTCRFGPDHMVCSKGDDSGCLYLIQEGQVEISVSSKDGKIIVLGLLSKGDVFGEIGLLDKGSRTADVTAKTEVSLYQLSGRDFTAMAQKFGLREWAAITTYVCRLFRHVANNLEETSFLDTDIRVLKKILEVYERGPKENKGADSFTLDISQELLGRMVGLSREATNKILARLGETGLIEKKYKHILVPDIARLRLAIGGDKA